MTNEPKTTRGIDAIDVLISNRRRAVARAEAEKTRALMFAIRGEDDPTLTDRLLNRLNAIIQTGESRIADLERERQRVLLSSLGAVQ